MNGPVARAAVDAPIEADAVGYSIGPRKVLDDLTLSVRAGHVHVLLGGHGAGKTTLLRILAGLVEPTTGMVRTGGRASSPRALRAAVGLVPSAGLGFYPNLSARENLAFFARLHGLGRGLACGRADAVLRSVGLRGAGGIQVRRFSPAMAKRLSFARALLGRPQTLLVDDATRTLDRVGAQELRDLATSCARAGAAVLWATSRSEELGGFCDRAAVLQEGGVRFEGDLTTLAAHVRGTRYMLRVARLPAPDRELLDDALEGIAELAGPDAGDPSHVRLTLCAGATLGAAVSVLVAGGVQLIDCHEDRAAIDDAFLDLVGAVP